ncbi:hypothetical protein [Paracoccus sp. (in: a-proteobacteria)]|uniref:hypothetical protein n=1 Tax=Paracoccus sp. TaxID=267 RepID=UPI0040591845
MKITVYNAIGKIVARMEVPDEAVEANTQEFSGYAEGYFNPETQYFDFASNSIVDMPTKPSNWHVFDFETKQWIDTAPDHIEEIKATAINKVNQAIGQIRSQFVTVIPAQDMIYQNKEDEAKAYLADADPVLADYPFIAAEVGVTAPTVFEVAQVYVNMAFMLRAQAAQLENVRLSTIAAIEQATDASQVATAVSGFEAALSSL